MLRTETMVLAAVVAIAVLLSHLSNAEHRPTAGHLERIKWRCFLIEVTADGTIEEMLQAIEAVPRSDNLTIKNIEMCKYALRNP